ncbi:MAG: Pvc16 family protein [Streptosporangiaceae bacterium]
MPLDLSAITDTLIKLVTSSWDASPLWAELDQGAPPTPTNPPFTPNVTGLAPDVLPTESGPQLGIFLYHVEPNNAMESLRWAPQNVVPQPGGGEPVRFLPMALDLYYLMSAFSAGNYHWEQQAMSVALRIFHASPIIRSPAASPVPWELTLTMEHRSYDEMSRLWQATTSALRLSVIYRAAVVFIDPDTPPPPARESTVANFIVEPLPAGAPAGVDLFGTFRRASYHAPSGVVPFTQAPATAAAGQTVWLVGANLAGAAISLLSESGTVTDISGWAGAGSTATRIVLQVPSAASSPPGVPPAPGRYQVRVGDELAPLTVAAFVDPAPGPVLPAQPSITLTGEGFVSGATEVSVAGNPVPASQITVASAGTSLTFPVPTGPAGTVGPISVRVNGVESDPALWATL